MSEMLLLGAGASVEANIPAACEMTRRILSLFSEAPHLERHHRILAFVIGGLLFDKGIKGENPIESGVNVEELFNAVDLLSQRNRLEASPFIGSWHSMVEEFDRVTPPLPQAGRLHDILFKSVQDKVVAALKSSPPAFGASDIDRKLKEIIQKSIAEATKGRSYSSSSFTSVGREVEKYLRELIARWTSTLQSARPSSHDFAQEFKRAIDQQPRPANGAVFHEVSESMIKVLVDLVWIPPTEPQTRVTYLAPILNLLNRQQRLVVTTLNYDNTIEFLSRSHSVTSDPGLATWTETGEFAMTGSGLYLLKLHGSIDWELSPPHKDIKRVMPQRSVRAIDPISIPEGYRPAVIFGQRNKLTAEGPFLDILRAFRDELVHTSTLTVVGYSFGDAHVNEYISTWLNGSEERVLQIVNRNFDGNPQPYVEHLKRLGRSAPSRVKILQMNASAGLETLYGAPSSPVRT